MSTDNYVRKSLELHLFFVRIMKEHSLFLRAGFTPKDKAFSEKAEFFKREFEKLLSSVVALSNGIVSSEVLDSGEVVTEFTSLAERQTEKYTGITINGCITQRELALKSGCNCNNNLQTRPAVRRLNQKALRLTNGLISFKEEILQNVLCCRMFTMNYPLLIEHIIREAKLYRDFLLSLEKTGELTCASMKETECFWNRIMMEHAMFIRGLLDPSEAELFNFADGFVKDYEALLEACNKANDKAITPNSLTVTGKFRDFKAAGTKGIEQCKIRSVILPLLADHTLREANHYLRLLEH